MRVGVGAEHLQEADRRLERVAAPLPVAGDERHDVADEVDLPGAAQESSIAWDTKRSPPCVVRRDRPRRARERAAGSRWHGITTAAALPATAGTTPVTRSAHMASNDVVILQDAHLRGGGPEERRARARGLLGRVVWALQGDRSHGRGAREAVQGQGQGREDGRRRAPAGRRSSTASARSRRCSCSRAAAWSTRSSAPSRRRSSRTRLEGSADLRARTPRRGRRLLRPPRAHALRRQFTNRRMPTFASRPIAGQIAITDEPP